MLCAERRLFDVRSPVQRWAALLLVLMAWPAHAQPTAEAASPAELVDTRRARDSTFPAVAVPFGFNLWTPVTQLDAYRYEDNRIQGFAASHALSPTLGDYASFQILPSLGEVVWRAGERAGAFSHTRELAQPHYYRVELQSGVRVEITPTLHAAAFRITFPARAPRNLLFDLPEQASGVMQADPPQGQVSGEVTFRGPKLFFFAKVDAPLDQAISAPDGRPGVAVSFKSSAPRTVTLRVGTSYLSAEQARAHVQQEVADLSFDALKEQARAAWDSVLGRITVEGATNSQRAAFYYNLYRALLYPSTMTEQVDGTDRHQSPYTNSVRTGPMFVNQSFANTYQSAWPLYFLLVPEQAGRMLEGFVNAYREGGWLPRESAPGYRDGAIGTRAAAVFADAYQKGIRNFDVQAAYAGMLKDALVLPSRDDVGRAGQARGPFRGYIPREDTPASAAWHFASSSDDYSVSLLARALGDQTHAEYFRLRSLNYARLFDPQSQSFSGRRADGTSDQKLAEANAPHDLAPAAHDPGGVLSLYGGPKPFAEKLDALLAAQQAQRLVYMYDYLGQPWQTQKHVRQLLSADGGEGEPGWYVLSALGFYPARLGEAGYAIGSPLFTRSQIALANGNTFEIVAHDNSDSHVYIQRAMLNGQPLESPCLAHTQILNGGKLELYMADKPSLWGSAAIAAPELAGGVTLTAGVLEDCAQGGAARASSEHHEAGEVASAAFDDDSRTKWLAQSSSAWLSYQAEGACVARFYTLTSADDEPARDPKEWTLEGSNDEQRWVVLDQRHNEDFAFRHQTRVFRLQRLGTFRSYRLRITANHGDPMVQLAELELLRNRAQRRPPEPDAAASAAHEDSLWCELAKRCSCSVAAPGAAHGTPAWLLLLCALRRRTRRSIG